jgi:NAD(P)-dependent dehydrogenase (short-subunit alcohol dehydrogenase family)
MQLDLSGKRAVVVGGSKGLGLDTVAALAARGCRVAALARSAGALAGLQQRHPERITFIATDIADPASVRRAFATVAEQLGGIDYLVLNAALTAPRRLAQMTDDDVRSNLDVNMAGPIYCLRDAAPLMQGGVVVYISSESVNYPFPMLSLYAAVKAGMESFMKGLRGELYRERKIHLVTFRAGSMEGTSFSASWGEEVRAEFFKVAQEGGYIGKSGTAMKTAAVAEGIVYALTTPPAANIDLIEFRSADSH